jgi:hypothetical protein
VSAERRRGNPLLVIVIVVLLIVILVLLWLLFGRNLLPGGGPGGILGIGGPTPTPYLPPPPSNIQADQVAIFDVFVEWQDNSDNEDGFYIYRETLGEEGDPVLAGTVGEDEVEFLDADTICGETYHYTVASFNDAGESPATPCWDIVMPLCPVGRDITFGIGASYGYNFLSGSQSAANDLYLGISDTGQLMFMADLAWQLGLMDLGEAPGDIPLDQTDMPADPTYVQDGVPAMIGHRYVAQATDGVHLILFDLTTLGEAAEATYILWTPREIVDLSRCEVAVGGYTPGGGCFAGDGICDSTCPTGDEDCGGVPPGGSAWCVATCGDGICDEACLESCATCPMDCICGSWPICICGDGVCDLPCGETCETCPEDCICGVGCADVSCGDGICTFGCDETCETCLADCWMTCPGDLCGDGHCNVGGGENVCTCPEDCSTECGDGFCYCFEGCCPEDCLSCEMDCGACDSFGCAADHCGNGVCDCEETTSDCPADCPGGGPRLGDCGAPCETSENCMEGLSCFARICWEDCICEGHCGEEPGEPGGGCQTCQTDTECGCPNGSCVNGCCVCN